MNTNTNTNTPAENLQKLQTALSDKKTAYSESDIALSKQITSCNQMYQHTLDKLKDLYCANSDYAGFVTDIQSIKIKELQDLQEKNDTLTVSNKRIKAEFNGLQRQHNELLKSYQDRDEKKS
jgi:hypothetical protein